MTKLSKILLIICLSIICICCVVQNTLCADISSILYTIDLVKEFPNYNNYYNLGNISYINYKNFCVYRNTGDCLYGENISDLPSDFTNGRVFIDNYTTIVNNIELSVQSEYRLKVFNDHFILSCIGYNVNNLSSLVVSMKSGSNSYSFDFHFVPFEFLNGLNGKITNLHLYGSFSFFYDIEYNGQYFYNDTFCFSSDIFLTNGIVNTLKPSFVRNYFKQYKLYDNYGDMYKGIIDYSSSNFTNNFLYFKNSLYTDRYVSKVDCFMNHQLSSYGNVTNLNRIYFGFRFKYVDYESINSVNLFSGSSTGSNGSINSLIPNGANQFYKDAQWYDIPTHLYNFFIYLVFDAPIISNFTKLAMVIINFLVETFNFVIGLFDGVSNVFFISIFVGMLALIFLLKIIFGGKT